MAYCSLRNVQHWYDFTPAPVGGETLVFIHGWLLSHHYWRPVTAHLQDRYGCLVYDLRGFGASVPAEGAARLPDHGDAIASPYGLRAYAEDLEALLTTLNLDRVWLVGHSLGGSIALWAAHLWPERVAGVVCVNAGGGIYLPQEFARFRAAGAQIVRWRSPWLRWLALLELGFARMMVHQPLARHWGRQRLLDLLAADRNAALGSLLDSTTEAEVHRLPQVVAGLTQPVYFIGGAEDTVMEPRYVRHLASFHPLFQELGSNVTLLPNCGHMAMVEQPEALSRQLQRCLELGSPQPVQRPPQARQNSPLSY
jgi:pimeloyl-ACP methyl ester carboxylesterase